MPYQGRSSKYRAGQGTVLSSLFSSSWASLFFVIATLICLTALFLGVIWFLAYGFTPTPDRSIELESASEQTEISWYKSGAVAIHANDLDHAISALGFVHASHFAWHMALLRQTALGDLTPWFGSDLLPLDHFTRSLHFAELARSSYQQLPAQQKQWLANYSNGVNAVLREKKLATQDEFAILDIAPEPWQPWHSLAIERLFAWLSTDLSILPDSLSVFEQVSLDRLSENDLRLRNWLQLHSFNHSIAGIWPEDSLSNSTFFHRFVYGSSASPLFHEIRLNLSGSDPVYLGTIPGTLLFPSGFSKKRSWFILPTSTIEMGIALKSSPVDLRHERLRDKDGKEFLLVIEHYPYGLPLNVDEGVEQDTIQAIRWPGFNPGSDIDAFIQLLTQREPQFTLLDGHGLLLQNEQWSLLGTPPFVHELNNGILIGASHWSSFKASRINNLLAYPEAALPDQWPNDCFNPWAEEQATYLIEDYLRQRVNTSQSEYQDALTYLRNWDFTYDPSSIGATIFGAWLDALPDSTYNQILRRDLKISNNLPVQFLQQAIDSLKLQFGSDLSKWRLDITNPIYRSYPSWALDTLFTSVNTSLSQTLYAPLSFPGKGHAATLCWGSFRNSQDLTVSSRWDSWSSQKNDAFHVSWRKHDVPSTLLGRHLIANRPSTKHSFSNTGIDTKTVIRPGVHE